MNKRLDQCRKGCVVVMTGVVAMTLLSCDSLTGGFRSTFTLHINKESLCLSRNKGKSDVTCLYGMRLNACTDSRKSLDTLSVYFLESLCERGLRILIFKVNQVKVCHVGSIRPGSILCTIHLRRHSVSLN